MGALANAARQDALTMIDLLRLQTFIHAAESLSFSEAARQMHLTQPTVSHHIKMLETGLGVDLFERTGGSLKLTDAGRLLLPRARKLVRQSVEVERIMEGFHDQIVGEIRIACSTTTGKYILPQFAARFQYRNPAVRMSILRCTPDYVVPRLLEDEADLGVISHDVLGDDLELQEFFSDHIVLIVPTEHSWAKREYVDPSELIDQPLIVREQTSASRRVMLAELGRHDIALDDMNIFMELGNAEAIIKTIEAGFGVSFVSRLAAEWALDAGTVVEVPVAGFDLRRMIYMVRRRMNPANRAVEAFWGFIHDPLNADLLLIAEQ
jgi:DNA-binding transcriptional LysR family regulator